MEPKTRKHPPGGYAAHKPVEQTMTDELGNNLFAINNGLTIELYTQLKDDDKRRYIGTVDIRMKTLTVKRNRAVHLHRKTNSYAFNFRILETGKTFDRVRIIDHFGSYVVPVTVIMHEGRILNFASQGFEKQVFLNIDVISQYKTNDMF